MPTLDGSLIRRAAAAACLLLTLTASAFAQQPVPAPSTIEFLSRYDFHLSAATLVIDDERFSWDTHFGGDVDVVDYVKGRISAVIDYEAVLGSQLRAFDPNQGNYTLEASASWRLPGVEVAGMMHHVSRHLSDRPKIFPIAWNIVGGRALSEVTRGATTVDAYADLGWVTERANVDYQWSANADAKVRRSLTPRIAAYVEGVGHLMGTSLLTDPGRAVTIPDRPSRSGGSIEAGLRLAGTQAVAELYGGFEHRFDADPRDYQAQQWGYIGFRVVRR